MEKSLKQETIEARLAYIEEHKAECERQGDIEGRLKPITNEHLKILFNDKNYLREMRFWCLEFPAPFLAGIYLAAHLIGKYTQQTPNYPSFFEACGLLAGTVLINGIVTTASNLDRIVGNVRSCEALEKSGLKYPHLDR